MRPPTGGMTRRRRREGARGKGEDMARARVPRRVQRYPTRLTVKELNGKPVMDLLVVDLSAMGARLEGPTPLAARKAVDLTLRLPGSDVDTRLSGQVMWLRPLVERPGFFQMGIQFFAAVWDLDRLGREGKLAAG